MEHEVFVPVLTETIRQALADPARVAASLPGWQSDPGEDVLTGRLRLRVGGSTITYRGSFRVTPRDDGFAVEGEGTEARGTSTVKFALGILVEDVDQAVPGTMLSFNGSVSAEGRLASFDDGTRAAAARRLFDRFTAELAAGLPGVPEEPDVVDGIDGIDGEQEPELADEIALIEVDLNDVEVEVPETAAELDDLEPPAEAAHARRTMIGRSAEEVDHAPPRGRYAPAPSAATTSTTATLRWAAPAAAVLLASAVVVGRVLRRRR
ncbi:SRPBCC domain-containing protein [Streptomyces sp. H10-C2]|uniref:SRPBCC domain-containing protein n=1 Tax=unclassified Streptomyces TaxID=2593676 RepID=UPI0024B8DB16|nr:MULTISPECIES: SRPBCC domain-containing protein [unclassified Streptomyces]MDJ0340389.1 SRPBCC domain-containing protein [Streptomyces sp. PH10-H1]MDJ0368163.1 SRPBCC domain-containing protein [Streptomyces sp. H10-C2]